MKLSHNLSWRTARIQVSRYLVEVIALARKLRQQLLHGRISYAIHLLDSRLLVEAEITQRCPKRVAARATDVARCFVQQPRLRIRQANRYSRAHNSAPFFAAAGAVSAAGKACSRQDTCARSISAHFWLCSRTLCVQFTRQFRGHFLSLTHVRQANPCV